MVSPLGGGTLRHFKSKPSVVGSGPSVQVAHNSDLVESFEIKRRTEMPLGRDDSPAKKKKKRYFQLL